jgi:hypothetical protein
MKLVRVAAGFFTLAAGIAVFAQGQGDPLRGQPAPVGLAERTIVVGQGTRWVNVTQGETVRFSAGGADFAWRFDGRGYRPFELREIAPAGAVPGTVTVYVTQAAGHRP